MNNYIGEVPLTTVQNVSVDDSTEFEEIDLVGKDSNLIVRSEDGTPGIEIECTLIKQRHPEDKDLGEQAKELKSLVSNDAKENTLNYGEYKGRISVENISIPQNSNQSNLVNATIEGKFLEWPEHFPGKEPIYFKKRMGGDNLFELESEGLSFKVTSIDGQPKIELDISDEMSEIHSLEEKIILELDSVPNSSVIESSAGKVVQELDVLPDMSEEQRLNGLLEQSVLMQDVLSTVLESVIGHSDIDIDLDSDAFRGPISEGIVDLNTGFEVLPDVLESSYGYMEMSEDIIGDNNVEYTIEVSVQNSLEITGDAESINFNAFGRGFGRYFGGGRDGFEFDYGNEYGS